jgi:succinate dehydrogenase / fumarate reductase flavoprotein subunit
MREVLIIGSGIAGMACAIRLAEQGVRVTLVSPAPSERAQSVMAAGGINAVTAECEAGDSVACHVEDTLRGGAYLAGRQAVEGLCGRAEEVLRFLERIGTVFSVDESGRPMRRAFGGQSYKRTHYCGAATGKLIVSALVMEVRRYEAAGLIRRQLRKCFHSALIADGVCHGALLFDEATGELEAVYADATVMATGGQNALFGKTTGSTQCDGYAAGRLFQQGAELKNLEFIQYHPTTLETANKRMLISEAVRGEGGRLFYIENGARVYFLEDKYGPGGNLMTRDVISREMEATGRDVYLDVSFLDPALIDRRLPEVRDLCRKYRGIDITREPIPVAPSVHFFMGGLAVHLNHETNLRGLFAVGECASMYHGANRLGGNSLLAALYSGGVAADEIAGRAAAPVRPDFTAFIESERKALREKLASQSPFPAVYVRDMLADTMRRHLGIVRDAESLRRGIADVDYDLSVAERIRCDASVSPYVNYSLTGILTAARATLLCALSRSESRGAHWRRDFPETDDRQRFATIISYDGGRYTVRLDKERAYES